MGWFATDPTCTFCGIVAGRVRASRVYEDPQVLAFMDIHPAAPGDLLVIPTVHATGLQDIDETLAAHLFRVVHLLVRGLRRSGLPCEGVNVFLADGEAADQTVFHLHVHVFPRTTDDRFRLEVRWQERSRADLDDDAARIRAGLTLRGPDRSP
ncbi:HIT family protein [Streptomyces chromofuscus]|uniref:HIT family protein n=1 Tax=Streptomyces chromofuscus TaxID=42881 RepID=A0A7M2T809_STRCW|nr:HIT family protein [Streptomyces chromofuscus]QOV44692.1 HIT family protein [Streptomyces chromofuscus]